LDYDDYFCSLPDHRGGLPLYFQDLTGKALDEWLARKTLFPFYGSFKMKYREG